MINDERFRIENQFKVYCETGGFIYKSPKLILGKNGPMSAVQISETRRAFFGAWGFLLKMMKEDLTTLPEQEAIEILDNMMGQVKTFWEDETKKQYGIH